MKWKDRIISDKTILVGKPVIKGTRISIDHIFQLLSQGWSEERILENYPQLTKDDLLAVFAYVYDCLKDGLLFPTRRSA